jgi:hypothetical protein
MKKKQEATGGLEETPGATDISNNYKEPETQRSDGPAKEGFGALLVRA